MMIKQILLGRTPQTECSNTGTAAAERYSEQTLAFLAPEEVKDIFAELGEQNEAGRTVSSVPTLPGYFQLTHVALATILPEEKRMKASCAGLCYIQILNINKETQQYLACVAAIPSFLDTANPRKVHHLTLTRDQLCQMLPWNRTLQRLETCCVREVLQAYVYQLSGIEVFAHPYELGANGLPVQVPVQTPDIQRNHSDVVWTVLPEVFVSAPTAQNLAGSITESAEHEGKKTYPQRLFWLKTVIAMLNRQMLHLGKKKHAALEHLYMNILGIAERICAALKRRSVPRDRQFWINVEAVRRDGCCLGWHIVIGLPQAVLQAWGF